DDQVKIRGFRVELGEIEDALRAHPAVADAAVLAVPAAGGDTRLAAYMVTVRDVPTDALRAYLSGKLPEYMVPNEYARLGELPRTRNGKVDRKRLGHSAVEPSPRRPTLDDLTPEQISALLRQLTSESARRDEK
ncbi:MAG TPA: hypothetical protein VHY31_14235, partial [Streptosporangiaceae bacterium]|nr:hypothetical protein [Streptosporangiaceae bacterium]